MEISDIEKLLQRIKPVNGLILRPAPDWKRIGPSLAAELLSLKQQNEWIPTSERLPEQGNCQTYEKMSSPSVNTRWFIAHSRKFVETHTIEDGGDVDVTYFVTHWRELPSPPIAKQVAGA